MRHLAVPALLLLLTLAGCAGDSPAATAPDPAQATLTRNGADRVTAAERWDALTRAIVARREFGPLGIARTFALVSVAQYDAVIAAGDAAKREHRPSEAGAAAGAAAAVLAGIYPAEQAAIAAQLASDEAYFGSAPRERGADFAAGVAIGQRVASAALARAATDGSAAAWTGTIPVGPGFWVSAPPPARPLSPLWGQVRPWLMTGGDQFRPATPPAFGSAAFQTALTEARRFSDTRTPQQLASAQFWGFGPGSSGPAGYWSQVALGLATSRHFDERGTTRMLAVMHMAGMDASIGCWDAKYAYWYIRPFQADPAITTPVGRPNFPSYPSAHSCLMAGMGGVLAGLFPSQADQLRAQVTDAGLSRIYAGLHFRFDVDEGQTLGYAVAALALERAPRNRAKIPLE